MLHCCNQEDNRGWKLQQEERQGCIDLQPQECQEEETIQEGSQEGVGKVGEGDGEDEGVDWKL